MKIRYIILNIILLLLAKNSFAQPNSEQRLIFPFLTQESQSNIDVIANWEHPLPCPTEYTNLISNTNLFSLSEQKLLQEIPLKYKDVRTNSGPIGTEFNGFEMRELKAGNVDKTFQISCFTYTNSAAREEIAFFTRMIIIHFRTGTGDGYNAQVIDGKLACCLQYKNWVADGIYTKSIFDRDHCNSWARFADGKIIEKYIDWNQNGIIINEIQFPKPFDFLRNETIKFDLAWDKIPTSQTNSSSLP